jgi:hypothetical protein
MILFCGENLSLSFSKNSQATWLRELFGQLSHSQEKSYEITKIFGGFGVDF